MSSRKLGAGTLVAGKYLLLERLGGGGMGDVYRAEHQLAGRLVALKILRPDYAEDPSLTQRFFQEAQAANRIRHPNIIDVLDAGFSEQGPYVAMACLDGVSLSTALARAGKLSPTAALAVVLPVLDALDAAHRAGIIHRDLKPENIYLARIRRDGSTGRDERVQGADVRVTLLDFGIAKMLDTEEGASPRTRTGVVFGTPDYLSPEQASGDGALDARSDLFSIGIVLFELMTGRRPFEAPSAMATAYKIVHATPPTLAQAGFEGDPRLQTVLDFALAKSKEARVGSASAFSDMLAPFVSDGATRRLELRTVLAHALEAAPDVGLLDGISHLAGGSGSHASVLDPTQYPPPGGDLISRGQRSALAKSVELPEASHGEQPPNVSPTLPSNVAVAYPQQGSVPPASAATRLSNRSIPFLAESTPARSAVSTSAGPASPSAEARVVTSSRSRLEIPLRASPRASGRSWLPRPLPPHVAGKCHVRGSLPRAVRRWIERSYGTQARDNVLQIVPAPHAEPFRSDSFNALVWYDLETLDTFIEASSHTLLAGDISQWRVLARHHFDANLSALFRAPRTTDVAAMLKRTPAVWSKIFNFGTMLLQERTGSRMNVRVEGFDAASLAVRYVSVGTIEGLLRSAGCLGASVRILTGEASFSRDFEYELTWAPNG